MRTIKEMCDLLGLTHRTFRYYDSIGLLKPAAHTKAGYRLYDNESVIRMVKIRVLADIGYELTEIKKILDFIKLKNKKGKLELMYGCPAFLGLE